MTDLPDDSPPVCVFTQHSWVLEVCSPKQWCSLISKLSSACTHKVNKHTKLVLFSQFFYVCVNVCAATLRRDRSSPRDLYCVWILVVHSPSVFHWLTTVSCTRVSINDFVTKNKNKVLQTEQSTSKHFLLLLLLHSGSCWSLYLLSQGKGRLHSGQAASQTHRRTNNRSHFHTFAQSSGCG